MWVNRFPLRGDDVELLAASVAGDVRASRSPPSTRKRVQRRLAHLSELGLLLRAGGGRRDRGASAVVPVLASSAAAALADRPDLPRLMNGPSALAVLACLPDNNLAVPAITLSGLNRKTWRKRIDQFTRTNLVLEPNGVPTVNPNLTGLHAFLAEYRHLFERVPPDAFLEDLEAPSDVAIPPPHQTVHQAGLEVVWSFKGIHHCKNVTPVGPSSGATPYHTITTDHTLAYHGPRRLDLWDHALLYCKSQARYVVDSGSPGGRRLGGVGMRAKDLFIAMMSPELAEDQMFLQRALFYRLGGLVKEAREVFRNPDHPDWIRVKRLRHDHGIEEGSLAHPR